MINNKILLGVLVLVLASLACNGSILKPAVTPQGTVSTATPDPSPTVTSMPVSTETAKPILESCTVTAESLHLRDTPGVSGIVIAWPSSGDQLTLLSDSPSGDWVKVQFGELTGWIHSHYCER